MTTAVLTTPVAPSTPPVATVPIDLIDVLGDNVRPIDWEHVTRLAGSMKLRGMTTPLKLRAIEGGRFALVAGEHRLEAAKQIGLTEVPYSLQTNADRHSAEAATENVLRKALNPLEEARAAGRLVNEDRCTFHSAAQILGWLRRRGDELVPDTGLVKARLRILDLPEAAQQLVGDGRLRVSFVPQVLAFHALAPDLLTDFLDAVGAGELEVEDLYAPGWNGRHRVARLLAKRDRRAPFAAIFDGLDDDRVRALKVGKRAAETWKQATELYQTINGSTYYHPPLATRFDDLEVDQARNVGALLVLGEDHPISIILDRSLYRDLARQAIARQLDTLQGQQAAAAAEKAAARRLAAARPKTAADLVESEHRARMRDLDRQAHGVNLDLWMALRNGLEVVDPTDMNVAKFFAYGLLGADWSDSVFYSPTDYLVKVLAANGIRLVVAEHRTEETPRLKSGRPGRTKITYGDARDAVAYVWKYIDGAKTAGELYGRVMVVFAAQHYARQCVLPRSRRTGSRLPHSKDQIASKAFEKVATKHLPASYRQLKRSIEQAARDKETQLKALKSATTRARRATKTADAADVAQESTEDGAAAQVENDDAELAAA